MPCRYPTRADCPTSVPAPFQVRYLPVQQDHVDGVAGPDEDLQGLPPTPGETCREVELPQRQFQHRADGGFILDKVHLGNRVGVLLI
jgi:hypothetical protein